jgi:hypothetical protein
VPQATALQVLVEFAADMNRQVLGLLARLVYQVGIVFFDELVEKRLFGSMAVVGDIAKGLLTFGPYLELPQGDHVFEIEYSSPQN